MLNLYATEDHMTVAANFIRIKRLPFPSQIVGAHGRLVIQDILFGKVERDFIAISSTKNKKFSSNEFRSFAFHLPTDVRHFSSACLQALNSPFMLIEIILFRIFHH